ncbi:MAG: hypothetical protein NVS3B20_25730 [Polyangiales bacterium]
MKQLGTLLVSLVVLATAGCTANVSDSVDTVASPASQTQGGNSAGSVHLSIQARYNVVTGMTEVDASTGVIHDEIHHPELAPGNITEAMYKALDASGNLIFSTKGVPPGGGCIHAFFTDLHVGDTVELHALVRDYPGDGNRTDSVKVSTTVF